MVQDRTIIFGLGESGYAAAKLLFSKGLNIITVDTRENPPYLSRLKSAYPRITFINPAKDPLYFSHRDTIVLSPGIDPYHPILNKARAYNCAIISEIELFSYYAEAPVIAVTGSNGKSTVTTLTAQMLKAGNLNVRTGGNLSPPATALLQDTHPDVYVLEVSSYQLQTTYSLAPYASTVLNVAHDHLDRHHTLEAYRLTKWSIYNNCRFPVYNRDMENAPQTGKGFTLSKPKEDDFGICQSKGRSYFTHGSNLMFPTDLCRMPGQHQWSNVLAACALSFTMNCSYEAMAKAVSEFQSLPHRCQKIGTFDEVTWINDSKSTNIGATHAAIKGIGAIIKGKVIILLGGQAKEKDFHKLSDILDRYATSAIIFGQDADIINQTLRTSINTHICGSLAEAVSSAQSQAKPGDVVLLSPACASFDMFKNFEERGDQFTALVHQLSRNKKRAY